MGQAASGGLFAAIASRAHAVCQGQPVGRCRVSRRAERASRPGTLMSWDRMVPVVALAWKVEARVPAVRVRLNAMVAQTSQALLAQKCPEGRCANGPFFRSAMTCSTIAWARWAFSAASIGSGLLVNTAVRHEALLFRTEVEGLRGWLVVEGQ